MILQERDLNLQRPVFDLDGLYCEEENFEGDDLGELGSEEGSEKCDENADKIIKGPFFLSENDLDWDDDELISLLSKEKELLQRHIDLKSNGSFMVARKGAVEWMLRVIAHYGFTVLTAVLAVNYFDRFIYRAWSQREIKPWETQLAAVACLSLAAKVEETQVPLLLDLQVEESKYVFEAKTIQRMELLVLSTLEWKMNPVTPLSFIDYTIRRLGLMTTSHLKFLPACEHILLSAVADPRFGLYRPSMLAAGTMLHFIKEVEPDNALDCQNELFNVLKTTKDEVDDCCKFISDLRGSCDIDQFRTRKRTCLSIPSSPNGVIDAYFSCDSSNESWVVSPLVYSSPGPPFKRSRSHDQRMRVAAPLRHF